MENCDIPSLSLISKLCDSRLKELTNTSCSSGASVSSNYPTGNSLYATVLSTNSSGSYNAHVNCCDFADPEAQQLCIQKTIALSKHIKSPNIVEFMNETNTDVLTDVEEIHNNVEVHAPSRDTKSNNITYSNTVERLERFLPVLKQRIRDGKWASLEAIPSIQTIFAGVEDTLTNDVGDSRRIPKDYLQMPNKLRWDEEQGLVLRPTDELMVFYGMTEKPGSIKSRRLKRLFDHIGVASLPLQNLTSNRKRVFLQDGTARILLNDTSGKLKFEETVSGVPVAVIGKVTGICLHVEDVIFATPCAPQWPLSKSINVEMVFVSGLYLGNDESNSTCIDLLQDYLLGLSGSVYEQKEITASRARVFFVGNLVSKSDSGKSSDVHHTTAICAKNADKLDTFLEPLVRAMEVFVIPGENDLTFTSTLPQPPLHSKVLPESGKFSALKRLTNPAKIQISVSQSSNHEPSQMDSECSLMNSSCAEFLNEDVSFIELVLQSGKNIKSCMDYCDIPCPVEMGKKLLKWAHLHPTSKANSPLAQDLFNLVGSLPHIMAIGNLSEFKSEEWNGTKIIGVPSFQKTNTAVVLTKDFDVVPISFRLA